MKTFDVKVTREGKWWMVEVPELDGLTQARRLAEVGRMATEWIALTLDVPLSEVEVKITEVDVAGLDVQAAGELVAQLREDVRQLEALISGITAATAKKLVGEGVPTRDVAEVLGLSHQRISQIVGRGDLQGHIGWNDDVFVSLRTFQANIERTLAPIRQQQEAIDAVLEPFRRQQEIMNAALEPIRRQQEAMAAALAPMRRHQDAINRALAPYKAQQALIAAALVSSQSAKTHSKRRKTPAANTKSETS